MRTAFAAQIDKPRALRALNFSATVEAIKRRGARHYTPLHEFADEMGSAYRTAFIRRDADPSVAVQLLSQSDFFAAEPSGRWIRIDSFQRPEEHAIRRWQLLIAGVGTLGETELFGRSLIADERLAGKYMSEDVFAISFKEPGGDAALYASAFLASRAGVWAVRATAYGTKTLKLRRDMLSDLPIPRSAPMVEHRIASLVRRCVEQRETYARELQAARRVLEDLPEMREAHVMCAERRARCVPWSNELRTMCAWTYASTGGALEYLQHKWRTRFHDAIEQGGMFNGPRFARITCDTSHGVEFMSQRDAFLIRPVPRRIVHPGFDDRLLFARHGTIMVGGHGTLGEGEIFGRAMLVHGRFTRSAFTQDLLRIVPRTDKEPLAYAFCTTLVGMRLLRSTAVGTKILSMRPDLLARLPFPEVDKCSERRLGQHIENSIDARQEAEQSESEAIRIIEEEVLPAWLA
ncbi:uncharacterized protein SOCEGT47_042980 [Sorangium cellulosum]|uniref:Type I restriction modification DNA specificity domain-containing protein n=1 Tax=Sorangium cellulosum TaxID=56 RepID=A0A4P2Q444_SORCE|nr:hypothetical protein [Sorangium cellulosum]AUX23768.1 uncharacterized protein SOCEGT47_042980 [Sorangium cellulosum]